VKPPLKALVPPAQSAPFVPQHPTSFYHPPRHAGFQNRQGLQNRTFDGRNCIIGQPLVYRDSKRRLYRTEDFLRTDGGSVPPLSFIGGMILSAASICGWWDFIVNSHFVRVVFVILAVVGFSICTVGWFIKSFGRWWWSYVFHDALFQDKVEISDDDGKTWRHHAFGEVECNDLLREAMRSQRAAPWERGIVWLMLNLFGWRAFDADRRAACGHIEPSKPWPRR
jgi:hypothetical protein